MATPPDLRARFPMRRVALGVAVTTLLFAWMARSADVDDVRKLWSDRRALPLAGAALAYVGVYACRAVRYRAAGAALPPARLFAVTGLHGFLNRVLPARGGELAYGYLIRRLGGGSFTSGMLGLVQIRILDLVAVAAILATALGSYVGDVGLKRDEAILAALIALVACAVGYLATGPLVRLAARVGRRFLGRDTTSKRSSEMLDHLDELATQISATPLRVRAVLLLSSGCCWCSMYLCYWLILKGVGVDRPLSTVILGASVANLASSLPVPAIGSFGPLEASWSAAFTALGLPHSQAIATAWTVSLVTLGFSASFALMGWITLTQIEAAERGNRSPSA